MYWSAARKPSPASRGFAGCPRGRDTLRRKLRGPPHVAVTNHAILPARAELPPAAPSGRTRRLAPPTAKALLRTRDVSLPAPPQTCVSLRMGRLTGPRARSLDPVPSPREIVEWR